MKRAGGERESEDRAGQAYSREKRPENAELEREF